MPVVKEKEKEPEVPVRSQVKWLLSKAGGWGDIALANRLGVTRQTVWNIKSGMTTTPHALVAKEIANVFAETKREQATK